MYKQPILTSSAKRILICPLNWGLGHATRCIPVIQQLTDLGQEVIIAADQAPLELLRQEFPRHESIRFPGPSPSYSASGSQFWAIARQTPSLLKSIVSESRFIRQQSRKYGIHAIISDNRYGAFHSDLPSVLITHQLQIRLPERSSLFEPLAQQLIHRLINRFDACWVPDQETHPNLSGDLSAKQGIKTPVQLIGLLSRFPNKPIKTSENCPEKEYVLAILSGPEPQRSLFEQTILNHFADKRQELHLLRGLPGSTETIECPANIHLYNYLPADKTKELIVNADHIICRSGYSSLMDLTQLGKKAFLVPTPGQTEQEYLAKRMKMLGWFDSCSQAVFSKEYPSWKKEDYVQPVINDVFPLREQLSVWLESI